jgi:Helix-turn-helix domain
MVFVPSAFTWPRPAASVEPPYLPFLVYPARGVGGLWEPGRTAPPAALAALLGARRAAVLTALGAPRSTTELARALELSPGSVSQHLSVLRDAGLVHAHRVGRSVLYVRSEKGAGLVA